MCIRDRCYSIISPLSFTTVYERRLKDVLKMSKRRQEVVYVAINVTLASISSVHLRQRSTNVYEISIKASKRCQKDVKEILRLYNVKTMPKCIWFNDRHNKKPKRRM